MCMPPREVDSRVDRAVKKGAEKVVHRRAHCPYYHRACSEAKVRTFISTFKKERQLA